MSKRHGDPSYEDLKAQGYLTQAILNYVALLGWSPKGELSGAGVFSLERAGGRLRSRAASPSPPPSSTLTSSPTSTPLYLRAMAPEDFAQAAEPYIRQSREEPRSWTRPQIAALLQARCEKLTDIPEKVDFFDALPDYDVELFTNKKSKTNPEVSQAMLEAAIPALEGLPDWTRGRHPRQPDRLWPSGWA